MAQEELKLFFDLDGTLIDISNRHHKVYSETIDELGGSPIDKGTYWDLKRSKVTWEAILARSGLSADAERDFLDKFIQKIESKKYLRMDNLFPGAIEAVDYFGRRYNTYLVSLRRNHENLLAELSELELTPHFKKILSGHSQTDGADVKTRIIEEELDNSEGIIIGDTEADVRTGQNLKLTTIAVTSGIRSEEYLSSLHPNFLVHSINDVRKFVLPN